MSEQLMRLAAFRRHHPGVVIGRADFGGWEARIPLKDDGEGVFAPRPLSDLLDALEEELHTPP
jgi:hypothetical protein